MFETLIGRGGKGDCKICIQKELAAGKRKLRILHDVVKEWQRFGKQCLVKQWDSQCRRWTGIGSSPTLGSHTANGCTYLASSKVYMLIALLSTLFTGTIKGLPQEHPFWTIVAFLPSLHLKQVIIYSYINNSHCSPQATELQLQLMHTGLSKSYTLSLSYRLYEWLKLVTNPTDSPVTYF